MTANNKTAGRLSALAQKKLFLFDIDGTIAVGDTLYDGSRELLAYIESIGGKAYYITNNSTMSGADYVEKFRRTFGLETTEDQFITSGYMTLRFLLENYLPTNLHAQTDSSFSDSTNAENIDAGNSATENQPNKIFAVGTKSFLTELRKNGLNITEQCEDGIACVVVAYDSELTYQKLVEASKVLLTTDVPFYGTNPDLRCPIDFGFIPDCGAICDMLTATTERKPIYLGKPNRSVVDLCRERSGFSREETLVVGDRLYTDIACGINGEVDTCVLFTGEAKPEDMKDTKFPATYEFENVRKLYEACRS